MTTEETFCGAVAISIKEGFQYTYTRLALQPLSLFNSNLSLPSWVPDLTMCGDCLHASADGEHIPIDLCPPTIFIGELLRQSRGFCPMVAFSDDHRSMRTRGMLIGTISATLRATWGTSMNSLDKEALATYQRLKHFIRERRLSNDIVLRALLGTGGHIPDSPEFDKMLVSFSFLVERNFHLADSIHRLEAEVIRTHEYILQSSRYRTLVAINRGHAGLTYCTIYFPVRPGDVLVGLFGINVPFMLRETQNITSKMYNMINVVHVPHHEWGHDFVENAPIGATWDQMKPYGLEDTRSCSPRAERRRHVLFLLDARRI